MSELSRREEALVLPIVAELAREPGLQVRDLGALIHRNLSVTLRVLQKLVDAGVVERRRVTNFNREESGLWLR